MTTPREETPVKEYFWVPEAHMFDNAPDCLDEWPKGGPACLVASHVKYDEAKAEIERLRRGYDEVRAIYEKDRGILRDDIEELQARARELEREAAHEGGCAAAVESEKLRTRLTQAEEVLRWYADAEVDREGEIWQGDGSLFSGGTQDKARAYFSTTQGHDGGKDGK